MSTKWEAHIFIRMEGRKRCSHNGEAVENHQALRRPSYPLNWRELVRPKVIP